jgi:hypothetical protein
MMNECKISSLGGESSDVCGVTSVWKIVSNFLDFSGRKKLQDTKQNPLNYLAYPAPST